MSTDMPVAKEILRQLGGNRFCVMTGAKNFVGSENSLHFRIGRNCKSVSIVRITLTPEDLYDVEFLRVRKLDFKVISVATGIYCDMLTECFEQHTGMYTSL